MAGNKGKFSSRSKIRHLAQYKDMSDDEFDALMDRKDMGVEPSRELERRIEAKLQQFSQDYDLTDLKINDREVLRGLIQAIISLEDYEQYLFKIRSDGMSMDNLVIVDKIQKTMADLRKSISDAQNDLSITRKVRKSDQETSVLAFIENLKQKAQRFYESRMSYVFCPKCNTLLATIWTLYPESDKNRLVLVCERTKDDGTKCGEKIVVGTKEMLENRNTNNRNVAPESIT